MALAQQVCQVFGNRLQSNLSGKQIAELMLADHGITDVRVISTEAALPTTTRPR